jgi:hypothetical protein
VRLPRGITGFRHVSEAALPTVSPERSRSRASILPPDGVVRSFHRALVDGLLVLCNLHVPWAAAARAPDGGEIEFVDPPAWLCELDVFVVLDRATLESTVTPDDPRLADLGGVELEQLRYWRPRRLGDLIFDLWD